MKRKNKSELMRVETVLNGDRLKLKDDFMKLMEADLRKMLSEYFYLETPPSTEIIKEGKELKVSINFTSSQIKNFINLP